MVQETSNTESYTRTVSTWHQRCEKQMLEDVNSWEISNEGPDMKMQQEWGLSFVLEEVYIESLHYIYKKNTFVLCSAS